jgi:hypothetical protein
MSSIQPLVPRSELMLPPSVIPGHFASIATSSNRRPEECNQLAKIEPSWNCTMIYRQRFFCIIAICLLTVLAGRAAVAQTRVGEAAVVKNDVSRVSGSGPSRINVGDALLRDETVRTGLESAARLVMADSTNLSLGPNATLKLDRTVFNDEHSYRDIAIRLTAGAFRFVTGNSAKTAYKITTELATIGVRGTKLDILSQRGKTTIVLQEGAARVCTIPGRTAVQCVELTQPGDTAVVTSVGGNVAIQMTNNSSWNFAANCAAAAGLCTVTQYADALPGAGSDPGSMLCGR